MYSPVKVLVVGGTYREFRDWCHDHEISAHDRRVRWINDAHQMRGWRDKDVILLGRVQNAESQDVDYLLQFNRHVANWAA